MIVMVVVDGGRFAGGKNDDRGRLSEERFSLARNDFRIANFTTDNKHGHRK